MLVSLLDWLGKRGRGEEGVFVTGKKFGAMVVVTLVLGVLMNCGYQIL